MRTDDRWVPAMRNQRDFVAALHKGLGIIECFSASHPRLTLSDASRRAGMTRAAARRYLLTLASLGYADFDGKFFSLTPRILRLGYAYLSTASIPRLAQPVLETLADEAREAASLAVLDGSDVLFIAHSAKRRLLSAMASVGTRLPAWCTAMGRVLLAGMVDDALDRWLKGLRPRKLTPKTLTSQRELLERVLQARADGYAVNDEELEMGLRSIAVPVRNSRGDVVFALGISLQAARMTPAMMKQRLLPALQSGSAALSAML
ncbi:MAG: IclR family transcriptional regulator [Betaproteobacteria bacterium RIFCSPLOWO2_12_FULL_65_14]|nr:MAG: IclR family transcriptional regulator [Betaproteobacteria bacterium RIFCSPLOWO2_12_FULL_65_14]